ncbi:MAG: hypothetical protein DI529_08000 [Chryseobacterium sp.]|nr:MAG: hypothetical protein DI529_08000 [Chryseobacterium sp.]
MRLRTDYNKRIMELITLKIFNTEIEAEMLKIFLETNDIETYVFGNILANTYNLFNNTSGGVQLKVSENDFEKANEMMNEFYNKEN